MSKNKPGCTSYLLRDVKDNFWHSVKVRATKDKMPIRQLIIKAIQEYLGRI